MYNNLLKNKTINKISQILVSIFWVLEGKKRKKIKSEIKNIYRNYKKIELTKLIRDKYPDYYCIFSRYGIGDIFFIASLLKEFKKKNGSKIVYFTEKKRLVNFLKAFPSIDHVVFDKDIKFLQEEQTLQRHMQKGTLNKLFFPYRGAKKTYTFSDNYNNMLDMPLDTARELPVINKKNYIKAEEEFEKLKLNPQNTVLLIPDATMFDYRIIDSVFWINLAGKLQNPGYEVVFNCNMPEYKHFKCTFLPIMDFLAFTKQVKYIVSFRSGISDLLAGMNMFNMSVIYPPNLEVIWADALQFHNLHKWHDQKYDNEFDNIFNIHSLNATFKTDKIDEIIYDYNDERIIERITNNCKK